jgi:hypothetical protein
MDPVTLQRSPTSPIVRVVLVIAAGLITTLLSLAGFAWLAANTDFNVMGWYLWYVVPIGALIVGFSAGSGYGLASWLSGRKISGAVLGAVLVLQAGAYAGAQWLEFKSYELVEDSGEPIDFWTYYDATTRAISFEDTRRDTNSEELGALGYAIRALELLGFALGGVAAPAILRSKPYCEPCQSYMSTRRVGTLPAAVATRKIGRGDETARLAYQAEMTAAFERGTEQAAAIVQAAQASDAGAIRHVLEPHAVERKQIEKLLHRIQVSLSRCVHCHAGLLTCVLMSGQGNHLQTQQLASVPVSATITRTLS